MGYSGENEGVEEEGGSQMYTAELGFSNPILKRFIAQILKL